jgi:hypothetical protein
MLDMTADAYAADPLVQEMRGRYPHLIAALATLPDGARHLRRIVDLDRAWVQQQQLTSQSPPIVVTRGEVDLPAETQAFDIIYAGGGLNLLNAAVMAGKYGRRVLVFDRFTVGAVHREWNISQDELDELVALGLLAPEELPLIIQRRYAQGLVRFAGEGIRVPQRDLWLRGVLDVAVDADALTALCLRKIRTAGGDNIILDNITFGRAVVGRERVVVQARDAQGEARYFAGKLLIDGMGATSPVACQLNCGEPYSLVCPTVGTVARGYRLSHAREPGTVDPDLGEILVTTEHAHAAGRSGARRQLFWEVFPGKDDLVAVYLFHYAEARVMPHPLAPGTRPSGSPLRQRGGIPMQADPASGAIAFGKGSGFLKQDQFAPEFPSPPQWRGVRGEASLLLPLFEEFFTLLPDYKDTSGVEIVKPVYGFIPAGYKNPALRAWRRKVLAFDRVVSLGDAAALQSPLTFCGFGSNARNLRRVTTLLNLALESDRLAVADLRHIRAAEAVPALARAFSKFMIAKPEAERSGASPAPPQQIEPDFQVNETLNVFCDVLNQLGERASREFFQDRVRWWDYTRLVLLTAAVYPRIIPLTLRTLAWGDGLAWLAAYGAFTAAAARNAVGRAVIMPLAQTRPAQGANRQLWRYAPGIAWRLSAFAAGLRQALRVAAMGQPRNPQQQVE